MPAHALLYTSFLFFSVLILDDRTIFFVLGWKTIKTSTILD